MDPRGAECVAAGPHRGGRYERHCQCLLHTNHPALQHGNINRAIHSGEALKSASREIQGIKGRVCVLELQ